MTYNFRQKCDPIHGITCASGILNFKSSCKIVYIHTDVVPILVVYLFMPSWLISCHCDFTILKKVIISEAVNACSITNSITIDNVKQDLGGIGMDKNWHNFSIVIIFSLLFCLHICC